jgi:hypothetical protein
MPDTEEEIATLVERELSTIADPVVVRGLREYLIPPTRHLRIWEYGSCGEQHPCWTVASDSSTDTGIVYSDHGFGPEQPWGLVFLSRPYFGMDSGWFPQLQDAFLDSFFAAHLPVWNVIERVSGQASRLLYSNLSCDEAFRKRDELAGGLVKSPYHVVYRGALGEGR